MELRLLFLLFMLAVACIADQGKDNSLSEYLGKSSFSNSAVIQKPLFGVSKELVRYKRGWGSVIITGASILIRTTSLGLSLGLALSEGCMYYPSICTNKKEIERLDKEIKPMIRKYDAEYTNTKQTYYDLRTATVNNGYIQYYINKTMQAAENLQDIEEDIITEMELMFPKLSGIHEASENITYDKYLQAAIGTLEYRLEDVRKLLLEHKKMGLIGIALQYVIEIAVGRLMKSFSKAYQDVSNPKDLDKSISNGIKKMNSDKLVRKQGFFKKIKLVPKALKKMVKNYGQRFKNFKTNIKGWKVVKNWKDFKNQLRNTFKKPIDKLKMIKSVLSPKSNKQFVKSYKLSWSARIMTFLGIAGDVISQIVSAKQWEKVDVQLKDARKGYEEYHNKLKGELKAIEEEKKKMDNYWNDIVEVFKNLSQPFKQLIINASQHFEFADVVGLTKLPIDTSSPFFSIKFDQVNKQTIASDQSAVLGFLNTVDHDMTVIEDKMKARRTLYQHTIAESKKDEPILDMLSDVHTIFRFSPSMTMKNFGEQLKLKDMVCTVSILRTDLSDYDFFPLQPFRPKCEVSDSTFETLKSQSATKRKRKLMKSIVKKELNGDKEESLSRLLDVIQNAYSVVSNPDVKQFGNSLTEQDIMCVIAEEFQSKQKYDLIPLTPFRPDCSTVSQAGFNQMKDDASKLRALSGSVKTFLDICKVQKYCPCLSTIATQNQVTEIDVVDILKQIDPQWAPNPLAALCSTTGCNCNHF